MVAIRDEASKANGSSIAFLMSFGGKKVLFGADAHPDILCESLNALGDGPVELDLLKVPHHGSQANVTRELMKSMRCSNFLISTSGARFRHPDQPAIARLIEGSVEPARLYFNYRQQYTEFWEDRGSLVGDPDFSCQFADIGKPITIRLI